MLRSPSGLIAARPFLVNILDGHDCTFSCRRQRRAGVGCGEGQSVKRQPKSLKVTNSRHVERVVH